MDKYEQITGVKLPDWYKHQSLARSKPKQHNEEGIDYGEVFTDFATPEFLDKNIRVRPVSGVTHGDETKDGR